MRALVRLVRLLVAVAAVAVSLAVLVGVPPLLLALGGNPLPRRVPSLDDVTGLLTGVDAAGRVLLWALAACGWVAWAVLAGCLLLELGARLVGRRAPRLPGLGGPQRLAGVLVAAALAGLTAVSPASAAADTPVVAVATLEDTPTAPAADRPPATPTGPAAAPVPGTPGSSAALAPPADPADPGGSPAPLVHEVARGDWMWHIAGRYLGDELRYPEIAALNPEYAARYPGFPDHIRPGDRLVLPADAYDRGERPHATGTLHGPPPPAPAPPDREPPPERERVDPGRDPERVQPDPEQVPPDPERVPSDPEQVQPDPEQAPPDRGSAPPDPAPAADPGPVRWPYPGPRPTSTPTPTPVPTGAPPPDVAGAPARGAPDQAGWPLVPLAGGLAASVLAAGAVVRWRRRAAHRPPGGTPAGVAAPAPAEPGGTDVDRLDRTLRGLAATGVAADVAAVWVAGGDVHLLLAAPASPPAPFEDAGTGDWVLPATAEPPDPGAAAPPFPALVTVGSRPGAHLLVDLERIGAVTVAGEPDRCLDLLRHVVAELAHHPWSRPVRVTVAGFPPGQARLLASLAPERVRVTDSVGRAAAAHRERLVEVTRALAESGLADARRGRVAATAPDAWSPWVLVAYTAADSPADRTAVADLADELSRAGCPCGVALVATWGEGGDAAGGGRGGAHPAAGGGHGRLTIGPDGAVSAAFFDGGGTLHAPALPAELLGPYAGLVRGGATGDPAGGPRGTSAAPGSS